MATYTSLINSVLTKLRSSQVAGPSSSDYAALIGSFVNETKREVEDAWKWTALRQTLNVTTSAGTSQYAITGATKRFRLQDPKLSVYDATNYGRIHIVNQQWIKEQLLLNTNQQQPGWCAFNGFNSSGDPYVKFYPIPADTYVINFELVVPQADFTLGTEILSVPDWPVILGAYAKAIAERGEDDGRTHGEAQNNYGFALSDAIAFDASLVDGESTWYA